MNDDPYPVQPLSAVQRTVLQLESQTWKLAGSKIAEFRRRHPHITETGYYLVLGRLLSDPRAYDCEAGRYAPMLRQLSRTADQAAVRRGTYRTESRTL